MCSRPAYALAEDAAPETPAAAPTRPWAAQPVVIEVPAGRLRITTTAPTVVIQRYLCPHCRALLDAPVFVPAALVSALADAFGDAAFTVRQAIQRAATDATLHHAIAGKSAIELGTALRRIEQTGTFYDDLSIARVAATEAGSGLWVVTVRGS
jgi:hypothetical protein